MQTLQTFQLHWHALHVFDFKAIIMNILKIKLHLTCYQWELRKHLQLFPPIVTKCFEQLKIVFHSPIIIISMVFPSDDYEVVSRVLRVVHVSYFI